jgi:hypothetical protein
MIAHNSKGRWPFLDQKLVKPCNGLVERLLHCEALKLLCGIASSCKAVLNAGIQVDLIWQPSLL